MLALRRIARLCLALALVLVGSVMSTGTGSIARAQESPIQGPVHGQAIKPTEFKGDLRSLPKADLSSLSRGLPVTNPAGPGLQAPSTPPAPDSVRQSFAGKLAAPSGLANFKGLSGGDPPDMNIDVGPKYIIETINVIFAVYDKTGGLAAGPFSITSLFSSDGGTGTSCDTGPNSDPVVLYDQQADRWIITILAWDNFFDGPYRECIAVSKTSDPISGGWYRYPFVASNAYLSDYPKLGVWSDAYYMMADMFDEQRCGASPLPPCPPNSSRIETFKNVQVWAFDRASILAGGAINNVTFTVSNAFSMVPSNVKGALPPAGRPNYFASVDYAANTNKVHIWRFALNGTWPSPPATFTGPTDVTVAGFNAPTMNVPQPGTNVTLDTLGNRLLYQAQYRNIGGTESLWLDHTVNAGSGVNGVRWYQLNVTGDVIAGAPVQQGTYSPDSVHRWMAHLAADRFGNMAIGYSASDSSTVNPSVRYTGRLAGDALGTLQAEATLVSGTGTFADCVGPCNARWGDYSSMEVDPVDDCTFWYVGEYADTTGNTTRIGSLRFAGCTADVAVSKSGPATVVAGTNLTYTVSAMNNGPVGAQSVQLTDAVPANTTFVSFAQNTGPAFTCTVPAVGATGTVTCNITALASGASATFTLVVKVSASAANGSIIANTAAISTASTDPSPGNNSSTSNTTVQTSADLAVNKTATTDPVIAGTNETYNLSITNNGPSDAQSVTLTDATPVNTTFVSVTQNTGPTFTCTTPTAGGTGTLSCSISTLAAGASATFSFVVHVSPSAPDGSTLSNTVSASSDTSDPTPANNSKKISTAVITRADLVITKSETRLVVIADITETYHLTVTNDGPSDAQSVILTDTTPANTTFVSFTQNSGPAFTCTTPVVGGTGNVVCTLTTLAYNASASFTMIVLVSPVDVNSISNTATAASTTVDPQPTNNTATITAMDSVKLYKKDILSALTALRATVTDAQDGQKLDQAIVKLDASLDPLLWVDGNTLQPKFGNMVFNNEADAVVMLTVLIANNNSGIAAPLQGFVDSLVAADRALADIALHQAISTGGAANLIAQAQSQFAQANSDAAAGRFSLAIQHFRNTWQLSQQAMAH